MNEEESRKIFEDAEEYAAKMAAYKNGELLNKYETFEEADEEYRSGSGTWHLNFICHITHTEYTYSLWWEYSFNQLKSDPIGFLFCLTPIYFLVGFIASEREKKFFAINLACRSLANYNGSNTELVNIYKSLTAQAFGI